MRNDYRFVSLWRVPASRGAVWEALERSLVPGPLTWWPFVSVVRLVAESTGDLVGRGSLDVTEDGPGSALTWTWEVETHRPWMRITGPLLRPVFVLAHTLVMRRGERGFRDTVR